MSASRLNDALRQTAGIPGLVSDEQMIHIGEVAERCEGTIIEVGAFVGRTTKFLALVCPGHVIAVDHFRATPDSPWKEGYAPPVAEETASHEAQFRANLAPLLDAGKVELIAQDSCTAAALLRKHKVKADAVFIDCDHTYAGVKRDIEAYLPLVKRGGLLFGHDYEAAGFPGLVQAVDELLPDREIKHAMWYYTKP